MSAPRSDPIAEIRRLYFSATPATILRDFDRAIDLLTAIQDPAERERAAGYMEGLAELRKEFGPRKPPPPRRRRK